MKLISIGVQDLSLISFDAGGRPEYQEKNLRKRVWTENQMHIKRRARNRTWDLNGAKRGSNRCANPLPKSQDDACNIFSS